MDKYICLDIGGTAIKYGLADSRGRLFNKDSLPNCIAKDGVDAFLDQVMGLIGSYQKYFKVQGAAISMAGMINPQTGEVIHAAPHFPGLTGVNLVQLVSRRLQLPCWVENDVNAAALGEYWLGNGRGAKSLFCITIGTGIGGAFVWDGRLWPGHCFTAGEVGQAKLGSRISWEEGASVTALIRKAARLKGVEPETLNGKLLCEMVRHGDKPLHRLLRETVHQWATGIAAILLPAESPAGNPGRRHHGPGRPVGTDAPGQPEEGIAACGPGGNHRSFRWSGKRCRADRSPV